jgi:hypothetical protein
MTRNYTRSEIYNFYDLSEDLQSEVINNYYESEEQASEDNFVIIKFKGEKEALPLSQFLRTENNNFTHGVYSQSYFSGYFLTLSRFGESCVVAYKYF